MPLTGFYYQSGVLHPQILKTGVSIKFLSGVAPEWEYFIPEIGNLKFSLLIPRGSQLVILKWEFPAGQSVNAKLRVRPFLCFTALHALQKDKGTPLCDVQTSGGSVAFRYAESSDVLHTVSTGAFNAEPHWYYSVYYEEESRRGYDALEDLFSPGFFEIQLGADEAILGFSFNKNYSLEALTELRNREILRRRQRSRLEFFSEQFLVKRGSGLSVMAGYPWFSDWGRDALISLRGLCLPFGRLEESLSILDTWGADLAEGLIPNSFPEDGSVPIYNSVDAALWYVIASYETIQKLSVLQLKDQRVAKIKKNIHDIIANLKIGTRFNIGMDTDGLLRAGVEGTQLTWMDAKVDNEVVTPRIGKPVEVQALWINSLRAAADLLNQPAIAEIAAKAEASFNAKFWNHKTKSLYDVVDVNHQPGQNDDTIRPNQIFACGGLPWSILSPDQAKDVLNVIESNLLTPIGLRTLSPTQSAYFGRYEGSQRERDYAYHQGTVWLWLLGAFVDAWLRVRGYSKEAKHEAKLKFLAPLLECSEWNGHLPEIADGDYPHLLRGSPFQAWSLGELIRISEMCRGDENI